MHACIHTHEHVGNHLPKYFCSYFLTYMHTHTSTVCVSTCINHVNVGRDTCMEFRVPHICTSMEAKWTTAMSGILVYTCMSVCMQFLKSSEELKFSPLMIVLFCFFHCSLASSFYHIHIRIHKHIHTHTHIHTHIHIHIFFSLQLGVQFLSAGDGISLLSEHASDSTIKVQVLPAWSPVFMLEEKLLCNY